MKGFVRDALGLTLVRWWRWQIAATNAASRRGVAFIEDLAAARFRVECLLPDEYEKVAELSRRYGDLRLGLADLSLIVLAQRFDCTRVATFDERRFRAVRPLQGGSFTLLPGVG